MSPSANTTGVTTSHLLPKVIFYVIAPVEEFFVIQIKQFSDLIGALKVVFAILYYT